MVSIIDSYTLYVGEHTHGFYALPSTAAAGSAVPMLNGPAFVDTISAEAKEGEFLGTTWIHRR